MNQYFPCLMPGYSCNMNSYIRVLHASPNAPAVDVYINNNPVLRALKYKQFSRYMPLMPGSYHVEVYPAGQQTNPVISTNVEIPPMSIYTVAASGVLPNISLLPISDSFRANYNPNLSYVKFVHLSPNAPAVDITLPDGTKLFRDVEFQEYTDYIGVNPGVYTLQVRPTVSEDVVLTIPNVEFSPGVHYSIYAVGLVGDEPPLEAIASVNMR